SGLPPLALWIPYSNWASLLIFVNLEPSRAVCNFVQRRRLSLVLVSVDRAIWIFDSIRLVILVVDGFDAGFVSVFERAVCLVSCPLDGFQFDSVIAFLIRGHLAIERDKDITTIAAAIRPGIEKGFELVISFLGAEKHKLPIFVAEMISV